MSTKQLILLFGTLNLYVLSFAQSIETSITFQKENDLQSEIIQVAQLIPTPFISVVAYFETTDFNGQVFYRTQKSDRRWSNWETLPLSHEQMAEDRIVFHQYIDEKTDFIQFKSSVISKSPLTIGLFYPGHSDELQVNQNRENSCSCPQPFYCGRDCWCPSMDCPPTSDTAQMNVNHIVVHHSAGGGSIGGDNAAVVRSIWDLHVFGNGWDDIGYNWLVDPNGIVYEGRGEGIKGAHFSCMNGNTVGICVLGNYVNTPPTPNSVYGLKELIAWEACRADIDVTDSTHHIASELCLGSIVGHRNSGPSPNACSITVCPGDSLYAVLPEIRAGVANRPCMIGVTDNPEDILISTQSVLPSNTMYIGDTLFLATNYQYMGDSDSLSHVTIDYYLSTDCQLDNNDLWMDSDTIVIYPNAQDFHTDTLIIDEAIGAGTYQVITVSDAADFICEEDESNNEGCIEIIIEEPVSLETTTLPKIRYYPNPVSDILQFRGLPQNIERIEMWSSDGKFKEYIYLSDNIADIKHLPSGIYFIRITDFNNILSTLKILKI